MLAIKFSVKEAGDADFHDEDFVKHLSASRGVAAEVLEELGPARFGHEGDVGGFDEDFFVEEGLDLLFDEGDIHSREGGEGFGRPVLGQHADEIGDAEAMVDLAGLAVEVDASGACSKVLDLFGRHRDCF